MIRNPKVKNKYKIKPKDIEKAVVINYKKLHEKPFWRNDVINAWCISYSKHGNSYWIGFYDEDSKSYAGKIRLQCSCYDDMCNYNFKEFFDYKEIENIADLEIQEELLKIINWMIDEKIIKINK